MLPHDLKSSVKHLPVVDNPTIVIFTGTELRHDRFALKIINQFGSQVVGWYRINNKPNVEKQSNLFPSADVLLRKVKRLVRLSRHPKELLKNIAQRATRLNRVTKRQTLADLEKEMFSNEIIRLQANSKVAPIDIIDPNAAEIVEKIQSLAPYFILTLGGAKYSNDLIDCATGIALNQHDGWCPDYKGSNTIEWTLFNRDYSRIGSTVHVLTSGMDAGPILRRSTACLVGDDNRHTCFLRSVALGTDLMCEAVSAIIRNPEIEVFEQPYYQGRTYLRKQMDGDIVKAVEGDFDSGLFRNTIQAIRTF